MQETLLDEDQPELSGPDTVDLLRESFQELDADQTGYSNLLSFTKYPFELLHLDEDQFIGILSQILADATQVEFKQAFRCATILRKIGCEQTPNLFVVRAHAKEGQLDYHDQQSSSFADFFESLGAEVSKHPDWIPQDVF